MKGIVLAGGSGTRLRPLTKVVNKQLLPVYDKPLVYYPIETLLSGGIRDILIISGPEHSGDLLNQLGSGKDFGARFTYDIQEKPEGLAQALGMAEDFSDGEPVTMILGDNIYTADIGPALRNFSPPGAKVFLKEVPDPERFGVPVLNGDRITNIIEKPKKPPSNYCVTGLYMYDHDVFDIIRTLKPSARGEYEITDVNNVYIERGQLRYEVVPGEWIDAGTFDSLLRASTVIAQLRQKS
ncbi:MAG: NTP transferase domain-containing protein [Candidatus Kerfeldbacteria bacterium]|nr:NTP transferase domain-containing protein [Candidatus Kerfeldbacteria bacterium]